MQQLGRVSELPLLNLFKINFDRFARSVKQLVLALEGWADLVAGLAVVPIIIKEGVNSLKGRARGCGDGCHS
jgi:hypothetical protein